MTQRFALAVFAAILAPSSAVAAADWAAAQPVEIVTTNYRFTPDKLTLRRGTAYRLHIENKGTELHEFSAPDLLKSSEIRDPSVLNADATEVQVPPGEARDVYFVPQKAGHFPLICPDHDWAGMRGEITVE